MPAPVIFPARLNRGASIGLAAALGLGCLVPASCRRQEPVTVQPPATTVEATAAPGAAASEAAAPIVLENVTRDAGIAFRHFPATRQSLLPEDMGSGLAWGDYDDDGDPDLFLVNFYGPILEAIPADAGKGRCALYRNEGDGRFTDVSRAAGLDLACFGMAAAWGDYDNDGDVDLSVTCYGPNLLFRNNGEGTFTDVTAEAGVGDARYSAGCSWGDYDRDGHIDLYVCNYVKFVFREADRGRTQRQYGSESPITINPSAYTPEPNLLYRNNGDGSFTDVAGETGVADPTGRSLCAAWCDFDDDGWVDLYIANDLSDNAVFRNRGDGTFENISADSLADDYRGAMGLAVSDYDRDGDLDFFVTHWGAQENALYENAYSEGLEDKGGRPRLFFMDAAYMFGVGHLSWDMVGWATGFVDFDRDGHSDLWVVNGHTLEQIDDATRMRPQHAQILRHVPPRGFTEVTESACAELADPMIGRGGAQADYDGDGRVDLAIMVHGGEPLLLRNVSAGPGHWIAVRLRQTGANTRALGARVTVRAGDAAQHAQVGADTTYLSQHDADLHFGLGEAGVVTALVVRWPDGTVETHRGVAADRVLVLTHTPQRVGP